MNDEKRPIAILIYDDRVNYETGLMLLALSIKKHFLEEPYNLFIFQPNASDSLQVFCKDNSFDLITEQQFPQNGWNIKPKLLMWGLDRGYEKVLFLDSDIIVANRPPGKIFTSPNETLVLADLGIGMRPKYPDITNGYGFKLGKKIFKAPSGCCIRATPASYKFLEDWDALLNSEEYMKHQHLPLNQRPSHAKGDDEVLCALLSNEKYSEMKLDFIESGKNIAQCINPSSYTALSRIINIFRGKPSFIHAMGKKPWLSSAGPQLKYSSYSCVAREHSNAMPTNLMTWLDGEKNLRFYWSKLVNFNPSLADLPDAIVEHIKRVGIRSTIRLIKDYRSSSH